MAPMGASILQTRFGIVTAFTEAPMVHTVRAIGIQLIRLQWWTEAGISTAT